MEAAAASIKRLRASASAAFVNWADLLPEILPAVAERIGVYEDFVAFRGVCKSWRSATAKAMFNPSQYNLPWLMLAEEIQERQQEEDNDDDDCNGYNSRKFFSLSKKGMILSLELPEARFKHCTSSLGWLITTDKKGETELLHPLTRASVPLPPLTTFKYYHYDNCYCGDTFSDRLYIKRATLSASPSITNDYVLMVILGNECRLAYWEPGDKTWNAIESRGRYYNDVIYYKNQFVTVDHEGRVDVCNIHGPNPDPHNAALGRIQYEYDDDDDFYYPRFTPVYLVELAGKLLGVTRHTTYKTPKKNDHTRRTTMFRVYEFDGSCLWQEINSLKGRSVFLGHNTGFSCNAETTVAIKANCIYFTDDCSTTYDGHPGSNDMGVYRLGDGLVDQHYRGDQWCSKYCPPLWVMPSL